MGKSGYQSQDFLEKDRLLYKWYMINYLNSPGAAARAPGTTSSRYQAQEILEFLAIFRQELALSHIS